METIAFIVSTFASITLDKVWVLFLNTLLTYFVMVMTKDFIDTNSKQEEE